MGIGGRHAPTLHNHLGLPKFRFKPRPNLTGFRQEIRRDKGRDLLAQGQDHFAP